MSVTGGTAVVNSFELSVPEATGRPAAYRPVEVVIDGVRLIDRVKRVEAPFAEQEGSPGLAGQYASLSAGTTFLPSRHFLGEPRPVFGRGGKAVVLVCTCGCEGCWDLVCRIDVTGRAVVWSGFEHAHRTWDYAPLGEFVFDRAQYEGQLVPVFGGSTS